MAPPKPYRPARSFLVLLTLSAILPIALAAWVGWNDRRHILDEAERSATRTVWALHEHVANVLETSEIVFAVIAHQVVGRPWEKVEQDGLLWGLLSRMADDLKQIEVITLVDAEGLVRLTTAVFPVPEGTKVEDREFFQFHRDGGTGPYVGSARVRADGTRTFSISRRLPNGPDDPPGGFAGVVNVEVPLAHLTDFWKRFTPTVAYVIPLVRSDGEIIARYPAPSTPARLNVSGPFLSRALVQHEGSYRAVSLVDGVERLNAFTQVKDYPLHLSFSVETRAVLAEWRKRMEQLGLFSALAAVALFIATAFAIRQQRAQRVASERWRGMADRLVAEMAAREKAEANLRRAQTLNAVGQLTAGVAHDFNNLLQAVRSGFLLLRKPRSVESTQGIVDVGLQAVERGTRLVSQMMVFARLEKLMPRPIDLRVIVAGMGGLLRNAAGSAVRIAVEIAEDLDLAMADVTQTELAILNLVINARDAMEEGGTVTITAYNLDIPKAGNAAGPVAPGAYIALAVRDTGVGMTREVLDRALEPFFTTKPVGKGTGLGLSMVHGFLLQSGGGVQVESEPDRGTVVRLYLPRAAAVARPERRRKTQDVSANADVGREAIILLVDDDALGRLMTAVGLREMGHQVFEARDAEEGLATLRKHLEIEVLITDYAMPGMNGVEFAKAVRAERSALPIIMITGQASETSENIGRIADAVLRKPFHAEDLEALIRAIVRARVSQ